MSENWQNGKKNLVLSCKFLVKRLQNIWIYLNLSEKIGNGQSYLHIFNSYDKISVEYFNSSGKKSHYSSEETAWNALFTTTPISFLTLPLTSFILPLKEDHIGDMPYENEQSTNAYASSDNILFNKVNLFTHCMIPKVLFAEEMDDDDNNFELVTYSRECGASKISAQDN